MEQRINFSDLRMLMQRNYLPVFPVFANTMPSYVVVFYSDYKSVMQERTSQDLTMRLSEGFFIVKEIKNVFAIFQNQMNVRISNLRKRKRDVFKLNGSIIWADSKGLRLSFEFKCQ